MYTKHTKKIPLGKLLQTLGITEKELRSAVRTQRLSDARAMAAAVLSQHFHLSQIAIAELFKVTQPGVCRMKRRHQNLLQFNAGYRQRWENVINTISNHSKTNNL